jgi:putative metal-binding protein
MRDLRLCSRSMLGTVLLLGMPLGCGEPLSEGEKEPQCVATSEVCNGQDDDCDAEVDEGLAGEVTCGVGACQASARACVAGAPGTCVPLAPRAFEACDGTDDDCDGQTDEGCECGADEARPCYGGPPGTEAVGPCAAGVQRCEAGRWGACAGATLPAEEWCNGVDDDCDAEVDEAAPDADVACGTGLPGACGIGITRCVEGQLLCVQAAAPSADLCNGVDDDCDPETPDGSAEAWFGNPCDGADGDLCMEGKLSCVDGAQACGDATATAVEVCNGKDDDCDGFYDEGFVVDTNPMCQDATSLGALDADTGTLRATGFTESFFRARVEDHGVGAGSFLAAKVTFWQPSYSYLEPHVRCASCDAAELGPTYQGYSNGYDLYSVTVAREGTSGDDGFELLVEIRDDYSAWRCGVWQLVVERDTSATAATCP